MADITQIPSKTDGKLKKEQELLKRENALKIRELNLQKKESASADKIAIIVSNTKEVVNTSNVPFQFFFLASDEFLGAENFRNIKHFYTDDSYTKSMVERTIATDPKCMCTFFDIKA